MSQKGVNFSKRQSEAIEWDSNREILVSAAAGSGKTTVLISRIIDRIVNKRIPIDSFLVVTFTHASANELKEKISKALNEKLKESPDDEWLAVQLANVGRASIGTMHSFCLKTIKDYHEHPSVLLPKSVRILSEDKSKQLLAEAIDEILTDEYAKEDNEKFIGMLDIYASFKNDDKVRTYIKNLYNFSLNNASPYEWIENQALGCGDSSYTEKYFEFIKKLASQTKALCEVTVENFSTDSQYTDMLRLSSDLIEKYIHEIEQKNFKSANDIIKNKFDFIALKGGKSKDENLIIQKNVLKYVKNEFLPFVLIDCDDDSENDIDMKDALGELCRVTALAGRRFEEKKRRAKAVDYSDMEHMTLRLFSDESVQQIFRSKFKHIMFDEYQDCNRIQEMIVQKIAGNAVYFMVGDVKQSIYGFRQAEPGLFLEKYSKYKYDPDAEYAKIELNENYRSRKNILNAANKVFFSIMRRDLCGMDYCTDNALNAMAEYPATERDTFAGEPVRLTVVTGKNVSAADKFKAQTLYAADLIKDFMNHKYVYDAKQGIYRRIKYSDIAILMRSPKNLIPSVREIFSAADIPVNVLQDSDINYAPEVNLLMCILQCIENPYNDIALMTVLHSYIFGVTDNELMLLMNHDNSLSRELIAKIEAYITESDSYPESEYEANGIDSELCCKLRCFIKKYSEWTDNERYMPASDFIDYIIDSTGYMEYFGSFENGQSRKENVLRLCDTLKQQLDSVSGGLYECCRILKNIDENGLSGGGSSQLPDAVSVMSIHKSKGLEFPVVFIMDADRSFSDEEIKGTILMHKDYGMVSRKIDAQNRLEYSMFEYETLRHTIKKAQKEEEQRILYVAMTRAKEQLIILGAAAQKTLDTGYMCESVLDIASANNFLKWITYSLCTQDASKEYPVNVNMLAGRFKRRVEGAEYESDWEVDICEAEYDDEKNCVVCKTTGKNITKKGLMGACIEKADIGDKIVYRNNTLPDIDELEKKLLYKYPYDEATRINSKLSVSQIKHIAEKTLDDDTYEIPDYRYDKIKVISTEDDITPVRLGTLYHFFMQHASIVHPYGIKTFEADAEDMTSKKLMTKREVEYLRPEKFISFFNSDVGKSMAEADFVEREKSFSYYIEARKIFPELKTDEKILVQGVIDCFFRDKDGKYILIDYKTDKVFEGMEYELVKRHIKQVELYKSALRDIMGIDVFKSYIYSFALERFIECK